jgi:hypothetical protein
MGDNTACYCLNFYRHDVSDDEATTIEATATLREIIMGVLRLFKNYNK